MRLNYDCVRDVLLLIEQLTKVNDDYSMKNVMLINFINKLPQYPEKEVFYSVMKLEEAGFIKVRNDNIPMRDFNIDDYYVLDITFEGHKYLNSVRNQSGI